jgi:hypothetical protein
LLRLVVVVVPSEKSALRVIFWFTPYLATWRFDTWRFEKSFGHFLPAQIPDIILLSHPPVGDVA